MAVAKARAAGGLCATGAWPPTMACMAFSAELWKSIEPIYYAILRHPFIRGLGDGSLDCESLKFYRSPGFALPARIRPSALDRRGTRATG
jgi:hypothetical protein